jgi:hypothetical protein
MTLTRATLVLLALGTLASCVQSKDDTSAAESAAACGGPTVLAGADQSVTLGTRVSLEVSGTVCVDGEEPSFTWTVESVPVDSGIDTGDLDVADPTAPSFAPDVVGTYVLGVVVTDSLGATSSQDLVVVYVESGNAAPIADCGSNLSAEVDQRVDLDGSSSADPEGAALTYQWTLSSAPSCSALGTTDVFNAATVTASVVPDCAGVFVVGLAVSDGSNWSDADYCSITVETGDEAPIADAGDTSSLSPCTESNFELDGYGSYDPEGAELVYMWTLLTAPSGSAGDFDDPTLANPVFHWDLIGTYTFQLQVSDGTAWSAPDIVSYTFTDESANNRPVANAGEDQTIEASPECSTASYSWTCEDCPSEDVELDGSASDDPADGDELDFLWTDASGELTIGSSYSPVTEVLTPSFASTYNVAVVRNWEVVLAVSDCADSDTDTVNITYTCTGEYSP